MTLRPTRFTLFPYTTLFRSRTLGLIEEELEEIWDFSGALRLDSRLEFIEDLFEELDSEARQRPDRKSTRLNSSHPSISYAVFCLKKKNNGSKWFSLITLLIV